MSSSELYTEPYMPVVLVPGKKIAYSETFILQHIKYLNATVVGLNEFLPLKTSNKRNIFHRFLNGVLVRANKYRLLRRLERHKGAILIEYGTTAASALPVLRQLKNKIVVHFHGYDAHRQVIVEGNRESYREVFDIADSIVVVSNKMFEALVGMGADPAKLKHIVCGVDIHQFPLSSPDTSELRFFACGRFVEKKAPNLTILAFHKAWQQKPQMRLRMAGDGPLLLSCQELVDNLGMKNAVEFLGVIEHTAVAYELQNCRAFLQHSVVAEDGDSEGTPVTILEAGACGVPVVATRHAGIPEVVKDGTTGILVDEKDISSMSDAILYLAEYPMEARKMGANARDFVLGHYALSKSIRKLQTLIQR